MAAKDKGTDSGAMPPLQKLLVERMRTKGWSAPQVEDRGISHATLHYYLKPRWLTAMPRDTTISALAASLELSEDEVRAAALLSIPANAGARGHLELGSGRGQRPEVSKPVGLGLDDEASDLTPEQIETVRAVIRGMKPKP